MDGTTHWINLYPVDGAMVFLTLMCWIVIYPLDSAIPGGGRGGTAIYGLLYLFNYKPSDFYTN